MTTATMNGVHPPAPTGPPSGRPMPPPVDIPVGRHHLPYDRRMPRDIAALKASIRTDGLQSPVVASGRNNLLAGHGRHRAFCELGLPTIPTIVLDWVVTDEEEIRYVRAADVQSTRHWLDDAWLLHDHQERNGGTWEGTGRLFSVKPATVCRYAAACRQPRQVLDAIRGERLTLTQMLELKDVEPEARKLEVLAQVIEQSLKPADIRALVRGRKGGRKKPVVVTVGKIRLEIPADMTLADLHEVLKTVLAAAITRGQSLSLGVSELQKLVNGIAKTA